MKNLDSTLSLIKRTEIDFGELREYIKQVFIDEFGEDIIEDVTARQNNPSIIDATVYVREKKDGMWDLCLETASILRSQGIPIGIRTELAEGTSE